MNLQFVCFLNSVTELKQYNVRLLNMQQLTNMLVFTGFYQVHPWQQCVGNVMLINVREAIIYLNIMNHHRAYYAWRWVVTVILYELPPQTNSTWETAESSCVSIRAWVSWIILCDKNYTHIQLFCCYDEFLYQLLDKSFILNVQIFRWLLDRVRFGFALVINGFVALL